MTSETKRNHGGFFAIAGDVQIYMKILYLFLSFPLGTIYFVYFLTGFSLGIGLIITLLGIPILVGMLASARALAVFERWLAGSMLRIKIPAEPQGEKFTGNLWARLKNLVGSASTWRYVGYLLVRFPMGLVSFVIVVTLVSLSLGLMFAPLYYHLPGVMLGWSSGWQVDTMPEALAASLLGVGLGILSLHAFKWLAWSWGWVARRMLSGRPRKSAPIEVSAGLSTE